MNSPLLIVLIVIVLVVGSTLSIMNKACKSGYHSNVHRAAPHENSAACVILR
jgi:hypothetical protein